MFKELIKKLRKIKSEKELNSLKKEVASKYNTNMLKNTEILSHIDTNLRDEYKKILNLKPTRSISGVCVIAIMSKPFPCPHMKTIGPCITCPGGINSKFGDVPQSYTGKEPATKRAIRNHYDPYLQMFNRLEQYAAINQPFDKVELIIMGGTFPGFPKKYQKEFITYSLKAMNDFSNLFMRTKFDYERFKKFFELPGNIDDETRLKKIHKKLLRLKNWSTLEKEQNRNEKSKIRCVGLTIETRPDCLHEKDLLEYGVTRIELGIQSVYDEILKKIRRGHTVDDNLKAIRKLKDLGFKLNFHYMLGLTSLKKDLEGLKELFKNPNYRPDMLKIYPCMVLKGTKLYDLFRKGEFRPMTTNEAAFVIAKFKEFIPRFCRIMRIQRDIPTYLIEAGVDATNLRQIIHERYKPKCKCIRCREIGNKNIKGEPKINIFEYESSKGKEFFIEFIDEEDKILGFCRLRFPSQFLRREITKDSALVRELHVYGKSIELGKQGRIQHKGYGKKLLEKAEELAKKFGKKKIVIISGVGVREYYKKLGYKKEGPYMIKKI